MISLDDKERIIFQETVFIKFQYKLKKKIKFSILIKKKKLLNFQYIKNNNIKIKTIKK